MKKQIVFDEQEFKGKLVEFSNLFLQFSKQNYGYTLVSNETNNKTSFIEEITGIFYGIWQETFKGDNT